MSSPTYFVNFEKGTLQPDVDSIGAGAMMFGHAGGSGQTATFEPGGLRLRAVRPAGKEPIDASSSVFLVRPGGFPEHYLRVRISFVLPEAFFSSSDPRPHPPAKGPRPRGGPWAVADVFKSGDQNGRTTDVRVGTTCQFRGAPDTGVRLNAPGATGWTKRPNLDSSEYSTYAPIGKSPVEFVLEATLDRTKVNLLGPLKQPPQIDALLAIGMGPVPLRQTGTFVHPDLNALSDPTAIEVAVALPHDSGSGPAWATARLLSFTVWTSP